MLDQWGIPLLIERNVLNQDEVQAALTRLLARARKPEVEKWIKSNLRNYLISDHEEVDAVTTAEPNSPSWLRAALSRGDEVVNVQLSRAFMDKLLHAIDYLNSDDADFDLTRLAVVDALDQADEWTHAITKKKAGKEAEKLAASGEEEIKKYSDGFKWLKLTSDAALDREGTLMGHCVGSYCEQVKAGGTIIYSLRDPKNEPHATIEVTQGNIEQIKGKENKGVVEKYHSYVQDFVNTMEIPLGDGGKGDLSKTGLLEINGKLMTLSEFQNSKNLKVGRSLDLQSTQITSLPADLQVGGDLYLRHTPITSLPAGLEVGGDLYIYSRKIKDNDIPEHLKKKVRR